MNKSARLALLSMACASAPSFAQPAIALENDRINLKTYLKRLDAVSCDKTGTQCVAVGFGAEYHMHDRLVYTSRDGGQTWGLPTLLASPAEEITPSFGENSNPAAIFCDQFGQSCIIASSAIIDKTPTPIVYNSQDGGVTWTAPKVLQLPKSVNNKQIYSNDSLHVAISCDQSASICTIAGGLVGDREALPFVYSTKDGGETWKLYDSLKQPRYQACSCMFNGTLLTGVSCDSSGQNCFAVGYSVIATSFLSVYYSPNPIVYSTHDAGAHWSRPTVLPIYDFSSSKSSALLDVSCDAAGKQCTTIGYSYDQYSSLYHPFSFTTRDGGENWSDINYLSVKEGQDFLTSLHCNDSGMLCTAAGWSQKRKNNVSFMFPLIYTTIDAGKTWNKEMNIAFPYSSILKDVFCNNSGENCIAVGSRVEEDSRLVGESVRQLSNHRLIELPKPQKPNAQCKAKVTSISR